MALGRRARSFGTALLACAGAACSAPRAPASHSDRAGAVGAPRSACPDGRLLPLVEDRGVYASTNLNVLTVHVAAADTRALGDVQNDVDGAKVRVIFQEGDFGAGAVEPNAVMELRGHSTRLTLQKSFQIALTDPGETWRGYRKINLNKHPYDLTRVRNKLAFDTFATLPDFTSLRIQFVHLFINHRDYAFAPGDLINRQAGLRQAIALVTVPRGRWYWRVVIRSDDQPDVNWMTPFGSGYVQIEVPPRSAPPAARLRPP